MFSPFIIFPFWLHTSRQLNLALFILGIRFTVVLIENFTQIITDLHEVVRNDTED